LVVTDSMARPAGTAQIWARALGHLAELESGKWRSFPQLFDALASRFESNTALSSPDETLTYRALAMAKNAYANWVLGELPAGSAPVALIMHNCASYMAIWLGIVQAGGSVALINTNLRGKALLHALQCAGARVAIVDPVLLPALEEVRASLAPDFAIWVHGQTSPEKPNCRPLLRSNYAQTWHAAMPSTLDACALLLFTSGTTGLPKAARVSHYRLLNWSLWFAGMLQSTPEDRLFDCLPMYHSTGGVAAIGGILVNGGSVHIRTRFSRRDFWPDVVASGSTIFLYIGELCRYLATAPFDDHETRHRLRLCCGNGLRADVWQTFKTRFRIPSILEFYASTEGNVALYNLDEKPGAVGRVPGYLAHRFPVALVACDPESNTVRRGADGKCIPCRSGESGEAIGCIAGPGHRGTGRFEGYTDQAATDRKILRDVFADGDAWFRTGDLMRQDSAGYYYFVDRLGDTFRWKGENVSTAEVSDVLAAYAGVTGAVVYGVQVKGEEGRAGMAALTVTEAFDLDGLPDFVAQHLPAYARPVFLRICSRLDTTETFKPIKADLIREAYDPALAKDPLYAFDSQSGRFIAMVQTYADA
jgi:fatty-acyl-CoA synthase